MNLVLAIVVEAYDKMREDADRETSLSAMQVLMDLKVQFHEFLDTMDDGRINSVREMRSHRNICWVLTTPQEKGGLKGRTRLHAGDLAKALCITHEGAMSIYDSRSDKSRVAPIEEQRLTRARAGRWHVQCELETLSSARGSDDRVRREDGGAL